MGRERAELRGRGNEGGWWQGSRGPSQTSCPSLLPAQSVQSGDPSFNLRKAGPVPHGPRALSKTLSKTPALHASRSELISDKPGGRGFSAPSPRWHQTHQGLSTPRCQGWVGAGTHFLKQPHPEPCCCSDNMGRGRGDAESMLGFPQGTLCADTPSGD